MNNTLHFGIIPTSALCLHNGGIEHHCKLLECCCMEERQEAAQREQEAALCQQKNSKITNRRS